MKLDDIAHVRLANQQITRTALSTPAEMVAWFGAMQAQDFAAAKWTLGLRLWPATDAAIEQAFNDGDILRTHVLRPTWHFVTPEDIRWILSLTSPRVHQANGTMYRLLELDGPTLSRGGASLTRALRDGPQLTREELKAVLEGDGIPIVGRRDRAGQRLAYIVMWAELEGLICSGPRRGKQFTYMLLDERAPQAKTLPRDEVLAKLVRRYFRSHGPATAADFARWSSLTLADTRAGLEAVADELQLHIIEGQKYLFANDALPPRDPSPTAYLLSIYDEYVIGYKDRSAIVTAEDGERLVAMGNALQNVIILDGQIVGTWRREVGRKKALVELRPFASLAAAAQEAVAAAAEKYREYLGVNEIDLRGL